jgi:hypothetical protein
MPISLNLLRSDWLHSATVRRLLPSGVKTWFKRGMPYADYRSEQLRREAEKRLGGPIPMESDYDSPHLPTLGILFDNGYTFAHNIAACRDLKVRYKVIDLMASDWVHRVEDSGCLAFLASPPTLLNIWHQVYEERLCVMAHDLKIHLCPTSEELYLWESKRRMRDWLVAHDVPHPNTGVFFDREQAMDFCRTTDYPIVAKLNRGAASSGIFVLRDLHAGERYVARAFGKGILPRSADARDRERGGVLFQRFVPHDYEWRIVRIGDDFLCRRKVRAGDFASGSGNIDWAKPLPGMLDFARGVTDKGGFRHMGVDLFACSEMCKTSGFLVNELQAIVGFRDVPDNEATGRWGYDKAESSWRFETGRFHQNSCANLRVTMLLRDLAAKNQGQGAK